MIIAVFASMMWFADNAQFVDRANREPCQWEYEGWHEVQVDNPKHHLLIEDRFALWTQTCDD